MSDLHVAIIMDGNGRWASERGLPRWRGHVAGMQSVRRIVEHAPAMGVATLTLYAFSADNWKRPRIEVTRIFRLLREYCRFEQQELVNRGVRVTAIGRRDRIPRGARRRLEEVERATAHGRTLHLRLAIDYSSRAHIADVVQDVVRQGGTSGITTDTLSQRLMGDVPPPDLLIRTAGERRISDFLLWEIAYTELHFTPVLWPEFTETELRVAIDDYFGRERRFGGLAPAEPQPRDRRVG